MAETGSFWNVTNPKKPYGELDVNDVLDVPMDWSEWLAEIGATLATHTLTPQVPLKIVQSAQMEVDTLILFRIAVDPLTYTSQHLNQKFSVTCHIVASDGQEKDRTLWFKLVEH